MRSVTAVFFILALLLFFSGCLGLKTQQDCDSEPRSAQIDCLHQLAITQASVFNDAKTADETCLSIWINFKTPVDSNDETPAKAETVTNNCLFDVARMTHNETVCLDIADHGTASFFTSAQTTQDMCTQEVTLQQKKAAQSYFNDPNSLCNVIAIFPFAVFATLFYKRQRKN